MAKTKIALHFIFILAAWVCLVAASSGPNMPLFDRAKGVADLALYCLLSLSW